MPVPVPARRALAAALCIAAATGGFVVGHGGGSCQTGFLAVTFLPVKLTEAEKRSLFLQSRSRMQGETTRPRNDPRDAGPPAPAPRSWSQQSAPVSSALRRDETRGESTIGINPFSFLFRRSRDRSGRTGREQADADVPRISVKKSGLDKEAKGYEEPPPPPPESRQSGKDKGKTKSGYVTEAVRDAIARARVRSRRWKYIVVHHSETRNGNARIFDYYHRRVRKMRNGLAYHFVIGNGSASRDGQIEVGQRWTRQLNGGHVASDYLNDIAIGICLVGNFNRDRPTAAQQTALKELVRALWARTGKTNRGRHAKVLGHKEINPRPTDCPGSRFSLRWLHGEFPP